MKRVAYAGAYLLAIFAGTVGRAAGQSGEGESWIAFGIRATGYELRVVRPDGAGERKLADTGTLNCVPAWSPDGAAIAFENLDEIHVVQFDGAGDRNLTNHAAEDRNPSWAPDGKFLVFDTNRDGDAEIYRMDADGGNPKRLTSEEANDTDPSCSPDGRRIAFVSDRDGKKQIYVMNADGSGVRALTKLKDGAESPTWLPDGKRIGFISRVGIARTPWDELVDYETEIFTVDVDASADPVRVTTSTLSETSPSWSPDGTRMVFANRPLTGGVDGALYIANSDGSDARRLFPDKPWSDYSGVAWSPVSSAGK